MTLSRRQLLAVLALVPLAACTQVAPSVEPSASASGEVVVYLPGALATQAKPLAQAFASTGATASMEVGHTPVQLEQLAQGATPDVWVAANPASMQQAAEQGLVDAARVTPLARTKLVIVVAPGNPAGIASLEDLAGDQVSVLLAAETLPIWMTTAKTFEKVEATRPGFTAAVLANTRSRELGVQPIVTKVTAGEADAGIVFVTDTGPDAETVAIPDALNTELTLSVAPVTARKNPAAATAFLGFLTEGAGWKLLADAGYLPPAP